jgi:hypothetical protein
MTLMVIQALVTLAVGICSISALTRKQPPIEETIGKIFDENKRDRESVNNAMRDHERRISRLEGRAKI